MSASDPALRAAGLVKRFGALAAVDGVDLVLPRGTCLALLGPNGAGKTTTIEMLEGLNLPDEGTIEVLGRVWSRDADEIRERIGVQLQDTRLTEKVTARETLELFSSFYRAARGIDEALEQVGLAEKAGARIETLSGGQHQRLSLACALINRPELLFLDEPTTGLDPQARRRVWEIVEAFKDEGGTVLLTTHYMEEAQRLADQVIIIDAGKIISEGTPREMIGRLGAESIVELHPANGGATLMDPAALLGLPGVREVRSEGSFVRLVVTDTQESVGALLAYLASASIALEALHTHAPTLEDVFVSLTGKHLRDG